MDGKNSTKSKQRSVIMEHNGSGISYTEPKPEDYDDHEDFESAWMDWAAEYPWLARKAQIERSWRVNG